MAEREKGKEEKKLGMGTSFEIFSLVMEGRKLLPKCVFKRLIEWN